MDSNLFFIGLPLKNTICEKMSCPDQALSGSGASSVK
jgi:hypothetical protein